MKKLKEINGITIIALVVTIIVLLILAGVTITTLNGESGILTKTQEAKEKNEIGNEREIVEQAVLSTMSEKSFMQFSKDDLQEALNEITIENVTKVFDIGEDSYEVLFVNSKRIYKVNSSGKLEENYTIPVKDNLPGNIETDENGNKLDGSIDKPYEINCIEDLVVFSNLTNGIGYKINEDGQIEEIKRKESFKGKYVVLNKTLDFKSSASYIDATRDDFGDINNNDDDRNELFNEMHSGTGFEPIRDFWGYFDGRGNEIKNIYINQETGSGLFGYVSGTKVIQNLGISGTIIATKGMAGGIIGKYNKGNSGIETLVKNCYNEADIYSYGGTTVYWSSEGIAGGIVGSVEGNMIIDCCYNKGTVIGEMSAGGIIGRNRCVLYY